MKRWAILALAAGIVSAAFSTETEAWFDETHLAIAKAAGYKKWFLAAAADVARAKIGDIEGHNHYSNHARGIAITPEMVLKQAESYDKYDPQGHLYGAIIGSFRAYRTAATLKGNAVVPMAYLSHYIGDLSMPLHHTPYNDFNKNHHLAIDGIINREVLNNLAKIKVYAIILKSEADLARETARIANLSKDLGYKLEDENRLITKEEAYRQISHSASLLKAVLDYRNSKK